MAAAAVLAMGFSAIATAEESGFYVTASAVRTLRTLDRGEMDGALLNGAQSTGQTLTLASSGLTRSAATWGAGVGYRPSPYFAVEASYLDLGRVTYSATGTETSFLGSSSLSTDIRTTSKGPAVALIGILPLLDMLEASARVGAFEGRTTTDYTSTVDGTPDSGSASKTSTSLTLGVGLSYAITGRLAIHLDYLHLNHLTEPLFDQSFNVDLVSAGLTFAF